MLVNYIPRRTYAIVAGYFDDECVALVGGVALSEPYSIDIAFPKANPFFKDQKVTLHLDNRTGVEVFDRELRVYRSSVKGVVEQSFESGIRVLAMEYQVYYSNKTVETYRSGLYDYPLDDRKELSRLYSDDDRKIVFEDKEFDNKLGVLVTRGVDRPHTTVMAFISTMEDDIYLISHEGTLKSRNLGRDDRCCFAIDHRANYHFEKTYDWNYTIIKGFAAKVRKDGAEFALVQSEFVKKNPWEFGFFSDPKVDMYRIRPIEVMCPEKYRKCR